jgi:hypothetical protein
VFADETLTEGKWYSQLQWVNLQEMGLTSGVGVTPLQAAPGAAGQGTAPVQLRWPGSHLSLGAESGSMYVGGEKGVVIASPALSICFCLTTQFKIKTPLFFYYRLPEKCVLSQSRAQLFSSWAHHRHSAPSSGTESLSPVMPWPAHLVHG